MKTGIIKAAAERIVIGIMMTESACDRLHGEIIVNDIMTSVAMMVEIVVIAMVMIGIVVMLGIMVMIGIAGGGIVDWVCPRSSCDVQP